MLKVGLVGCVKQKQSVPAPAKDLYVSPLFRKRRRYVERCYDIWYILSAKHHLVAPDEMLAPYDETLKRKSASERRRWAQQVFAQLQQLFPDPHGCIFYFHAGKGYQYELAKLLQVGGYAWHVPLEGLGIGKQLKWYSHQEQRKSR